jgi:hypothetical protein
MIEPRNLLFLRKASRLKRCLFSWAFFAESALGPTPTPYPQLTPPFPRHACHSFSHDKETVFYDLETLVADEDTDLNLMTLPRGVQLF